MVGRNMNIKCTYGESLDGNDKRVFGHQRRHDSGYKVVDFWLNYVLSLGGKWNL